MRILLIMLAASIVSSCNNYIFDPMIKEYNSMVYVEGGTFNPSANYTVTLSSYYIGKYEVTQSQYEFIMGDNPSHFKVKPSHPVEKVSWYDAVEYCNRLSIKEELTPCYRYGNYGTNPDDWPSGWNRNRDNHTNVSCNWNADGYRLPTEMEWEFAARGGIKSKGYHYSGSDEVDKVAWYLDNSGIRTHRVGTKAANELGLYDMTGNVDNWVWDAYGAYPRGLYYNPKGPAIHYVRITRGGNHTYSEDMCTVFSRHTCIVTGRLFDIGMRVVRRIP